MLLWISAGLFANTLVISCKCVSAGFTDCSAAPVEGAGLRISKIVKGPNIRWLQLL